MQHVCFVRAGRPQLSKPDSRIRPGDRDRLVTTWPRSAQLSPGQSHSPRPSMTVSRPVRSQAVDRDRRHPGDTCGKLEQEYEPSRPILMSSAVAPARARSEPG